MDSEHDDTKTNGDLRKDPSSSTTGEGDESATTPQQLKHSSSSSSSLSSGSSSKYCFQVSENEIPTEDEDNEPTSSLKAEPNQTIPNVSRTSTDLRTIPATTTSIETDVPTPASGSSPKVTFKLAEKELEDSRMAPRSRDDEEIGVSSRPKNKQRSHELAGSPPKPGSDSSKTQSPPTQVMERPLDRNSSGYRIPDYVFARTKSTAPTEWSTASNESLFSIHMGNSSFSRDQMFWLGKSGELGTMSPLVDLSSYQTPVSNNNNKPAQGVQNISKVTEAKAAETMREVIRESAENRDKENGASSPLSKPYPLSNVPRHQDDGTKSFAFPTLARESVSLRAGGKQSPQETPKATPTAARTPRGADRIFDQQKKWLSCFPCFRPFCS